MPEIPKNAPVVPSRYADAGVDVDAGARLVERIKTIVRGTQGPEVVAGVGGFASLYALPQVGAGAEQLLVASCDGVGTKLKVAFLTGRHETVGIDLVAMNVNDLLCTGARPLFFLDYFACGKLDVDVAAAVVGGIAEGCRQAHCALVGGETAEMPGFYPAGEYDLAGFSVGIVDKDAVLDGRNAVVGDVIVGLPSSGLHSNGYSLARRVLLGDDAPALPSRLAEVLPELGRPLADELLEPTRIYVDDVQALAAAADVRALVHVTGGGLIENPPRVLSESLAWEFRLGSWAVPPIFELLGRRAGIDQAEMRRTFNMGLGLLAVVPEAAADAAVAACRGAKVVGRIVARENGPAVSFVEANT